MRIATVLAFGLCIAAPPAKAQMVPFGAQPVSDEVRTAFGALRSGGFADLVRMADAGLADAQTYAGVLLAFQSQGEAERRKGCGYLEAASVKRSDAMHFLAESYQHGRCGTVDLEKAIATFHQAGDMGLTKSRCAEGNVLLELKREPDRAVRLCREGAEAGDPDAQTDLGNFYLTGRNVPRNPAAARGWYEKAAAQNQRNAAFTLGEIYWNGDGVTKDRGAAAKYWRIAYDAGRRDAATYLGREAASRALGALTANQAANHVARGDLTGIDQAALTEAISWYERARGAAGPADRPAIETELASLRRYAAQPSDKP